MTVEDPEQTDSYSGVAGPIFFGAGAVVLGMLGVLWVGLAGLVWRPWEFGSTYHWDDEGPFALCIALIFFAIAAGLMLWIIARGAWTWRRRSNTSRLTVVLVPILTVAMVFVGWLLPSPGNSQPTWGL